MLIPILIELLEDFLNSLARGIEKTLNNPAIALSIFGVIITVFLAWVITGHPVSGFFSKDFLDWVTSPFHHHPEPFSDSAAPSAVPVNPVCGTQCPSVE
ncbi:hypothetical protein [Corynebacterium mastitidis]|uniref:hypothetical protein n=1 Tax=Corynebacterium mastitidis TaxID=161890 RepID=UPI0012E9F374|nr:hypothetical protein [Corynebacterium mastitidis]